MRIISHRGRHEGHTLPDNSLPALRAAWALGTAEVEVDVWLSADQRIVLSHNRHVNGLDIPATTWPQLRRMGIARLERVLDRMPRGRRVLIEVKCGAAVVERLARVVRSRRLSERQVAFIAFTDRFAGRAALRALAAQLPTFERYALFGRNAVQILRLASLGRHMAEFVTTQALGACATGIDVHMSLVTPQLFSAARAAGLSCHVWGANSPAELGRLRRLGADSVTTDRPLGLE